MQDRPHPYKHYETVYDLPSLPLLLIFELMVLLHFHTVYVSLCEIPSDMIDCMSLYIMRYYFSSRFRIFLRVITQLNCFFFFDNAPTNFNSLYYLYVYKL